MFGPVERGGTAEAGAADDDAAAAGAARSRRLLAAAAVAGREDHDHAHDRHETRG